LKNRIETRKVLSWAQNFKKVRVVRVSTAPKIPTEIRTSKFLF
jgi:hypothetical protein